jgi:hypothetical protein
MSHDDRERRARSQLKRAREETLAVLELRHSGQRLAPREYEQKVAAARRATTTGELESLLLDAAPAGALAASPAPPRAVSRVPAAPAHRPPVRPAPPAELDFSDEQGFVMALLSSTRRKGHWEPPARLYVGALMGGAVLDFREADLLEGVTEVVILAIMGGVNIVVPPDLDVEVNGIGLLGGFSHLSRRTDDDDDSPLLRIRGLALMGGVEVKVKK